MSAPEGPQDPEEETSEYTDNDVASEDIDESGESEPTDESDDEESDFDEDVFFGRVKVDPPPPPPPWIDIVLKEQPGGMVDSQLLVGLKPSEELLAELVAKGFTNPHYAVVVTSISEEDRYNRGEMTEYHRQTSAYIKPLNQPYPYVTFSRPGRNRIWVTVIDINHREAERWADSLKVNSKELVDERGKFNEGYLNSGYYNVRSIGLGTRDVIVPKELFSDPSGWRRQLVQRFYPQLGADDCKFRSKLIRAAVKVDFVNLYGMVARPLLLLLAVVMLKREAWQRRRMFFAFNPHHFWQMSGESWWLTDKQGKDRKVLRWISPPVFGGLAAVFLGIPGVIYGIADMPWYGNNHEPRHAAVWAHNWGYWHTVAVLDRWIVLLAAVAGVVFGIVWFVAAIIHRLRQNRLEETQEERLARLKTRLGNIPEDGPDWDSLPDSQKTVRLRFANLKSKVCRPIAA